MNKDCVNDAACANVWERAYWKLVEAAGGSPGKLADILGLSRQAPVKWKEFGVPWHRALQLEDEKGFPPYEANPIIYQKDRILKWADQIRSEGHRSASRGKR